MKLSKSKLALAKVINDNGGWKDASFAAQEKCGVVYFYFNEPNRGGLYWHGSASPVTGIEAAANSNWYRCFISREEYYQAYPEVTKQDAIGLAEAINLIDGGDNPRSDADGWIEWKGGDCPVDVELTVYVNYRDGGKIPKAVKAGSQRWNHSGLGGDIMSYSLHKPEVKHEFCESVTRSIPEPEAKPTIEQLAQDYRNAKDYAGRLQKEAGEAAVKAEGFAVEIRKKILELQELIG